MSILQLRIQEANSAGIGVAAVLTFSKMRRTISGLSLLKPLTWSVVSVAMATRNSDRSERKRKEIKIS